MAPGPEREAALEEFYQKWAAEPLVVLKWLSLKAGSNVPGNVRTAKALVSHGAFNIKNPNNCYSLFMAFCRSHPNFHAEDGSGYRFLADSIIEVLLLGVPAGLSVSGRVSTSVILLYSASALWLARSYATSQNGRQGFDTVCCLSERSILLGMVTHQ